MTYTRERVSMTTNAYNLQLVFVCVCVCLHVGERVWGFLMWTWNSLSVVTRQILACTRHPHNQQPTHPHKNARTHTEAQLACVCWRRCGETLLIKGLVVEMAAYPFT